MPTVPYRMKIKGTFLELLTVSDLPISPQVWLLEPVGARASLAAGRQQGGGMQGEPAAGSHCAAPQCKRTEQATPHGKSEAYSPFLPSVFKGIAQNKPPEKDRFFECPQMAGKKKKTGENKSEDLMDTSQKKKILSYLGTLHFGTLCCLASDLPFLAHAEVTASAVPHLAVVPDGAMVQAASSGRHTLLTAPPGALHFVLPLRKHQQPLSRTVRTLRRGQRDTHSPGTGTIFTYLITCDSSTGLSQTSDLPSVTHAGSAGVFFPLFAMLSKNNIHTIVKHPC